MSLLQLTLTFREKDNAGTPIRRDAATCASMMKLPQARVELMLHRALRAIPLAIDHDPIEVSLNIWSWASVTHVNERSRQPHTHPDTRHAKTIVGVPPVLAVGLSEILFPSTGCRSQKGRSPQQAGSQAVRSAKQRGAWKCTSLCFAQVVYEDDDLLAVSKPPFISTAPRHRWEVSQLALATVYKLLLPDADRML